MNEHERVALVRNRLERIERESRDANVRLLAKDALNALPPVEPPFIRPGIGIAIACLSWAVVGFAVGKEW